jgi:hypothetical protein
VRGRNDCNCNDKALFKNDLVKALFIFHQLIPYPIKAVINANMPMNSKNIPSSFLCFSRPFLMIKDGLSVKIKYTALHIIKSENEPLNKTPNSNFCSIKMNSNAINNRHTIAPAILIMLYNL